MRRDSDSAIPAPRDATIPLVEETLHVGKRVLETGRLRVSLTTDTVTEAIQESLLTRHAHVERVAVGREVASIPESRQEGEVLIIPVVEEILVVEKRLFLKEEIRVRMTDTQENIEFPVDRRVQRATVEHLPADAPARGSAEGMPKGPTDGN